MSIVSILIIDSIVLKSRAIWHTIWENSVRCVCVLCRYSRKSKKKGKKRKRKRNGIFDAKTLLNALEKNRKKMSIGSGWFHFVYVHFASLWPCCCSAFGALTHSHTHTRNNNEEIYFFRNFLQNSKLPHTSFGCRNCYCFRLLWLSRACPLAHVLLKFVLCVL